MSHKVVRLFVLVVITTTFLAYPVVSSAQMPATGASAQAGQQPTAADMEAMMAGMSSGMMQMMQSMLDMLLNYFAKRETAVKLASFTRNYYDELIKQGFSKEDALRIVAYAGIPSMSMMK